MNTYKAVLIIPKINRTDNRTSLIKIPNHWLCTQVKD